MIIIRKPIDGLSEGSLARFTLRARRAVRLCGLVNVVLDTSREMRVLNRRFRGKDAPTDVLSFAALGGNGDQSAGEIVISTEIARQNARRLGHTAADEVRILILHGLLHLAGYDHERDDGRMARAEVRLRRKLGLPASLTERAAPEAGFRTGQGRSQILTQATRRRNR